MRTILIGVALAALVVAQPVPARAHTPGGEFGLAVGAAASNLVYVPAKVVVAVGGLVVGALTGFLTGGDTRAAYAVWVPAASGTYLLTPAHLEGTEPIEFFGSDYADSPTTNTAGWEGAATYEAQYSR